MHKYGFISNRIFDVAACGSLLVTDEIVGLQDIFGENVLTYRKQHELLDIFKNRRNLKNQSNLNELSKLVIRNHTFDDRVNYIMKSIGINSLKLRN